MITSQTCIQDFEFTQDFAALGIRTILLNAAQIPQVDDETSEQMILLAIEDITNRKKAEVQIRNSLQEKEVLLHEIRHRVKNNLQVISSLLSLQGSRVNNPEATQILQDSINRVQSIALMYETLHQSPHLNQLNFAAYVQTLVAYLFRSCNLHPEVVSRVSVPAEIEIDPDRALLVGLIVNELVTNALKYGFSDLFLASNTGEVFVEVSVNSDRNLILAVSNNSNSLPVDFDLDAIASVGLNLVKKLAEQLKGNLYFHQGNQTIISICFPLE
jgi:two-component system CheB/CheR fusion protein